MQKYSLNPLEIPSMPEEKEQKPPQRGIMRSKPVLWLGLLIIGFLVGFLWQFTRAQKLESEIERVKQSFDACQKEALFSGLRDEISMAYFEVTRKNYGLAGEHSTKYFNILRTLLGTNQNPKLKQDFESLLSMRDRVTAGLAAGDPAIVEPLQQLLLSTSQITQPPSRLVAE
jgi:hypothetical protein